MLSPLIPGILSVCFIEVVFDLETVRLFVSGLRGVGIVLCSIVSSMSS